MTGAELRFVVDDPAPLVDEPAALRLIGAAPGTTVRLRATCRDPRATEFTSWADFVADPDGRVDPGRTPALAGTYEGLDPYGLWWSMGARPERPFARDFSPIETVVEAEVGGEVLARTLLTRRRIGADVRVEPVRDEDLVATLLVPDAPRPAPAVIVLGGSEGGIALAEELAALLASRGFVALALAYFGLAGLPPQLVEVPVEYVERAAGWLARRPEVLVDRLGVIGVSRGAELALLLAALDRRVRAVVGFSASSVVWPGFVPDSVRLRSAWTRRGEPLAFAVPRAQAEGGLLACMAAVLADPRTAMAALPLERIRGGVLLVSGGDDRIWPARRLAEAAMQRLAASGVDPLHLHYPDAGHGVGRVPGMPAAPTASSFGGDGNFALGGTRAANARSAVDAWPRVLGFLRRHIATTEGP